MRQRSCGNSEHQCSKIAFKTRHQNLAFGVTKAGIIFNELGAFFGQHKARKQHTGIGHIVGSHVGDGRPDDALHHLRLQCLGKNNSGRIRPHATRIGPGVTIAHALVILR